MLHFSHIDCSNFKLTELWRIRYPVYLHNVDMQTTQPRLQNYCVLTKYLLSRLSAMLHHNRGWKYTMWCGTHSSWKTQWQLKCQMFHLNPKDESCPGTCDNTNKWSPFGNNVNQLPLEFFNFSIGYVVNENFFLQFYVDDMETTFPLIINRLIDP